MLSLLPVIALKFCINFFWVKFFIKLLEGLFVTTQTKVIAYHYLYNPIIKLEITFVLFSFLDTLVKVDCI